MNAMAITNPAVTNMARAALWVVETPRVPRRRAGHRGLPWFGPKAGGFESGLWWLALIESSRTATGAFLYPARIETAGY
jgi:hypothetical protein